MITGMSVNTNEGYAGLFGHARNAVIRGLIVKDASVLSPETNMAAGKGIIIGVLDNSILENCAALGGSINMQIGYQGSIGGLCGANRGVINGCFNSANISNTSPLDSGFTNISYVGGICGSGYGVISNCGNTGAISSISATSGIVAYSDLNYLTRCYSAGLIEGMFWRSEYEPGAIVHLLAGGYAATYSYFEQGTSAIGATVTSIGYLQNIVPLERAEFRDAASLANLGRFSSPDADWLYASIDSYYPIPAGIFRERAASPHLTENGTRIALPAVQGVLYFYTLDGRSPYAADVEGVESVDIALKTGESLTIFVAERGKYDSEIVVVKGE
jgi:hypothetical protein